MGREKEDHTEKILVAVYEARVDELKKIKPGDPAHIKAVSRMLIAQKDLQEYRKAR